MVDDPYAVQIDTENAPEGIRFRVQVAERDRGKMIGANGRAARSIRILLAAAGKKYGAALSLDVDG
jgi:predicted RNA-binding protein YlqC (UPF0109 family)